MKGRRYNAESIFKNAVVAPPLHVLQYLSPIGEVLDVMTGLAREGMTMVIVTHEMNFARRVADRVIFMDGGAILEEAPPDEFFTRPQTQRARDFLDSIQRD